MLRSRISRTYELYEDGKIVVVSLDIEHYELQKGKQYRSEIVSRTIQYMEVI